MEAMSRPLAIAFLAILFGGAAGGIVGAIVSNDDDAGTAAAAPPPQTASSTAASPADMYRRDAPGVVQITAGQSLGSGFVIDTRGDIVTNDHVVAGASGVRIGFTGGASYPAKVVGTDPSSDLAVVRVSAPASKLHPVAFDDSSNVQVGETVYAIGNPFGLDRTMTAGIVSATGRDIQAPDGLTIPNAIQTDAAINHGNSGGPLLDSRGRVIGVNAQIESESGGSDGVGFAIPSNTVRSIVRQLISTGEVRHAYLGVRMEPVEDGVAITEVVPDTPADDAGRRPATGTELVDGQQVPTGGDVIVEFDGQAVSSPTALQSAVDAKRPGETVPVVVLRRGERTTIEVTLGIRP
jgi:putative serine protease PepD